MMDNYANQINLTTEALNSQGFAEEANTKRMESFAAKQEQIKATMANIWQDMISSDAVKDGMDFVQGFLDLLDGVPAKILAVSVSVLSLATGFDALKKSSIGESFGNITDKIKKVAQNFSLAALKAKGFSGALTSIGLNPFTVKLTIAIAAIYVISRAVNYWRERQEKLNEKISESSKELQTLQQQSGNVSSLAKQYEELANKTNKSAEDYQAFADVQNELKEIIPDLNGYYDEQGNFVIQNAESVSDLTQSYKDYVQLKRQELAEDYAQKIDAETKAYERQQARIEELTKYLDIWNKVQNGEKLTDEENQFFGATANIFGSQEDAQKTYNDLIKQNAASLEEMRNAAVNALSSTDTWMSKLTADQQNAIRDAMSEMNADEIQAIYNSWRTNGEQAVRDTLKRADVQKILNKLIEAQGKAQQKANQMSYDPKSLKDQIASVNSLSTGFEALDKIYKDIKDKDTFDFSNLADDNFVETFQNCGDAYTNFISTISSSPNDMKKCQSSFDELVSSWLQSSGVLNSVTDETRDVTVSMLKMMGVAQASELVDRALAVQKQNLIYATTELAQGTEGEAEAQIALANSGNIAAQALLEVHIKKTLLANNNSLAGMTNSDIDSLLNMARAAGIASKSLAAAASAKAMVDSGQFKSLADLERLDRIINGIDVSDFEIEFTPRTYTGGNTSNKSSKSSSSKSSSEDSWLKAFEKEYETLQYYRNMELITEQEYYDKLNALNQKYFNGRSKYLEQYRKYSEELFKLQRDITNDYIKDQEHIVTLLENKDGTEKQRISIYENLQNRVHTLAQKARAYGLKEDSDYIQELQKQWWDFEKNIKTINTTIFEDRIKLSEDYISERNKYNDWGSDSEVEAWKRVLVWVKKYYDDGIIDAKEYASQVKSINEKLYDAIKDSIKKTYEEQKKLYETEKDNRDSSISAITGLIDEQIEALQKQKDALQESNDEKERELELERLKDALESARRNKNTRVYDKDKGWVWTANATAVNEAQKALDDFNFESQIDEIDKQIKSWEDYKTLWEEIPDKYQKEQNRLQAAQLLGADWENQILNKRLDIVKSFSDEYIKTLQAIADTQARLDSIDNMSKDEVFANANNNGGSSGSSGNASGSVNIVDVADTGGKTPSGLPVGTIVNTGGGAFVITGVKEDGSYNSNKISNTKVKKYATGGVNDFTGLAQLDGSRTSAETIFNATDSKKLWEFINKSKDLTANIIASQKTNIADSLSKLFVSKAENKSEDVYIDNVVINEVQDLNDFISQVRIRSKNR